MLIPYGGSTIAKQKCLSLYRFMPTMQSSLKYSINVTPPFRRPHHPPLRVVPPPVPAQGFEAAHEGGAVVYLAAHGQNGMSESSPGSKSAVSEAYPCSLGALFVRVGSASSF